MNISKREIERLEQVRDHFKKSLALSKAHLAAHDAARKAYYETAADEGYPQDERDREEEIKDRLVGLWQKVTG